MHSYSHCAHHTHCTKYKNTNKYKIQKIQNTKIQFTKILKPANYKISDAHLLGPTPQCTKYKMQNVQNTKYKTTKYQLVKGELPFETHCTVRQCASCRDQLLLFSSIIEVTGLIINKCYQIRQEDISQYFNFNFKAIFLGFFNLISSPVFLFLVLWHNDGLRFARNLVVF